MIPEHLEQARADLVALEAHTATLETNVSSEAGRLSEARRLARDGGATFEDVVSAQARHEAARGMLEQHTHDVSIAREHVRALEAAQDAAINLAEGREARAAMREAEAQFLALAERVESETRAALVELERLSDEHMHAAARLQGAVLRAGKTTQSEPADARRAFLAQVDPDLPGHFINGRHDLGLAQFPGLQKLTERRFR